MSKNAQPVLETYLDDDEMNEGQMEHGAASEAARPIPRISIQAFCEDQALANVLFKPRSPALTLNDH